MIEILRLRAYIASETVSGKTKIKETFGVFRDGFLVVSELLPVIEIVPNKNSRDVCLAETQRVSKTLGLKIRGKKSDQSDLQHVGQVSASWMPTQFYQEMAL